MTHAVTARELRRAWRAKLRSPDIRREEESTGAWVDPARPLSALVEAIEALEAAPRRVLKNSGVSRVVRGDLFGAPVVVKRYAPPAGWKRAIRRLRPSRARRCWATSAILAQAGIACSACTGFLEDASGQSVAVFADDPNAVSARRWIKAWLHQRPDAFRARFGDDLAAAFRALYDRRIYHADTKASNLLLLHPEDPDQRRFIWIDLDCVRFGTAPSPRRILRNLVQLNGSVGSKLSEADRRAFLEALAVDDPWLTRPQIDAHIRRQTRIRLERELSGQCGF